MPDERMDYFCLADIRYWKKGQAAWTGRLGAERYSLFHKNPYLYVKPKRYVDSQYS